MMAPDVIIMYFLNALEPIKNAIPVFATTLDTAANVIASTATSCETSVPARVATDKVMASTSANPEIKLVT